MVYRARPGPWQRLLQRLPASCLLCEGPADAWGLCEPCLADLPWNHGACPRCALPPDEASAGPGPLDVPRVALPATVAGPPPRPAQAPPAAPPCAACALAPPLATRALAPLRYEFPVNYLVGRLKYGGRLVHAPVLGQLLASAVADHPGPLPDRLLPVPLHPRRLAARGYNQALEIARPVARFTGLPLETALLRRTRATTAQMTLDRAARAGNPAGAFAVDTRRLAALGTGLRLALVDDVMTTGATLDEMARVLLAAGAAAVEYWVLARTP